MRQAVDAVGNSVSFRAVPFEIRNVLIPCAIMVGLMLIVSVGRFFWRYFIIGSSRRIEAEMRENLFGHLLSLSHDFYQKNKIGDLMARATNDLNAIRESIGMGFVALVDGTVMAVAIIIIIFVQDTSTAAWAILPLPLITVIILLFGKAIGKRFRRAHEAYSALSDAVQETFAGVRVVKSFVKEWWFIKKFAGTNDNYRDANMGLVRLFGIFFPFVTFLSGVTVLIVLLVGGIRVIEGHMTPGDLVALFRYMQMLIWPLIGAGWVVNMIQRGAVSLGRVNEIMRSVPSIRSPENPSNSFHKNETDHLIEIKNLSFEYPSDSGRDFQAHEMQVLDKINLSIKKGTVTGILGRTGSGKSTLVKIITRTIDPPTETVYIKGVESAAWDLSDLRKLFGVTPQDSYLFSDSIKNNISYGLEDADDETLVRSAALAALEKDFPLFVKGWETVIGERGLTLSGGQKQRTAIARSIATALAGDREILVLDDSLSAVDVETEKAVLDELFELGRVKKSLGLPWTMILISHRVSALCRSDEVIVLDKGRIIEQGTPAELVALGGFYARTAALQNLGDNERGAANG
jgi:ATP-binding cassette subfamily B protein